MKNKQNIKLFLFCALLICVSGAFVLYHTLTSIDITKSEDLINAINVTDSNSTQNMPLAVSYNGNFAAILFQESNYNKLVVLKKIG